jgi:radical SAM protein with 4Fe4S-binding SPASM domain
MVGEMSYSKHMRGYTDPRTLYQTDALYHWQHGEPFMPVMVEISPDHRCIQCCRYCYNQNHVNDEVLRPHVFVDVMGQLADCGVKSVMIQGSGEPLMHKSLSVAVEVGAKFGLAMTLTTNGVLLTPRLQEKLLPNLAYIRLSVVESDPKRYAFLHGCDELQWYKLIENIKSAVALRERLDLPIALIASVYLEDVNFAHTYEIVKFCKELGLDYISVQEAGYYDHSPAGAASYASTRYSADAIEDMRHEVLSLCNDNFRVKVRFPVNDGCHFSGMDKDTYRPGYCQGVKFMTIIAADGNVYPCYRAWGNPLLSYGSLYEQSFAGIWNNARRREIEQFILGTPPTGQECAVCNNNTTNPMLDRLRNATRWKDFLT